MAAVGAALAAMGYAGTAAAQDIPLTAFLTVTELANGQVDVETNLPIDPALSGVYDLGPRFFGASQLSNAIVIGGGGIVGADIDSFNFIDPTNPGHYNTIVIAGSGNHGSTAIGVEVETTDLDFGSQLCANNTYCPTIAAGSSSTVHYRALTGPFAETVYSGDLTVRFVDLADGGVPEPASWVLMIGGFGALGASLRRRRALAA